MVLFFGHVFSVGPLKIFLPTPLDGHTIICLYTVLGHKLSKKKEIGCMVRRLGQLVLNKTCKHRLFKLNMPKLTFEFFVPLSLEAIE